MDEGNQCQPQIQVKDFAFCYPGTTEWILKDINLEVEKGDFVAILGESGCGKSTLCKAFVGLIPQSLKYCKTEGSVIACGYDVAEEPIAEISKNIGLVFQDPEAQFMSLRVEDELVFSLENMGLSEQKIKERVEYVAEVVGIEDILDKSPFEISGGQKQRVVIGSVLAVQPEVIILDEPTSELDPIGRKEILAAIGKINKELGITIIYITHETEEAAFLANKVCLMENGKFVEKGKPREIFRKEKVFERIGVRVPQVTELSYLLQREGYNLDDYPYLNLGEAEANLTAIVQSREKEGDENDRAAVSYE